MEDVALIALLSASFSRQLEWYEELCELVQKTLGQLVLSRGDVGPVMADIEKKQKLFERIAEERGRLAGPVCLWQDRKKNVRDSKAVRDLEMLLAKTETAIQTFLDGEDQLKRYLEHVLHKGI